MIGYLTARYDPAHRRRLAVADIVQYPGVFEDHILRPFCSRTIGADSSTNVLNRVRAGPDRARRRSVVLPADSRLVEKICQSLMFKAGIHLRRLIAAGIDHPNPRAARCGTTCATTKILRRKEIACRGGSGCARNHELVRWKTRSLLSLERAVAECVLLCKLEVWGYF